VTHEDFAECVPAPEILDLLERYYAAGGVLDYVMLHPTQGGVPFELHSAAALAGLKAICRRRGWTLQPSNCAIQVASNSFQIRYGEARLTGDRISFRSFWGTDDVAWKPLGERTWAIPDVDGYKTAFFVPPHGLQGSADEHQRLFSQINRHLFGSCPEQAEIYLWSTDWSNYFDDGNEWWGAFYWTISPADSQRLIVIGASATD
jgi:hypothetical protein